MQKEPVLLPEEMFLVEFLWANKFWKWKRKHFWFVNMHLKKMRMVSGFMQDSTEPVSLYFSVSF